MERIVFTVYTMDFLAIKMGAAGIFLYEYREDGRHVFVGIVDDMKQAVFKGFLKVFSK